MNLIFTVIEGGFAEGGYKYVLRCFPTQGNQTNGNINIFSKTVIEGYVSGATINITIPLTASTPV